MNVSKKHDEVIAFIKASPNGEVTQPAIIKEFLTKFQYAKIQNARVCISIILTRLERDGLVKKRQEKNFGRGGILMNIWSLKEPTRVHRNERKTRKR